MIREIANGFIFTTGDGREFFLRDAKLAEALSASPVPSPVPSPVTVAAEEAPPKKTVRAKKAEAKAEPEAVSEVKTGPSIDEVRDALAALNNAKGLEVCRSLLDSFDAKNLSGLPESDYAAFKLACEAALVTEV